MRIIKMTMVARMNKMTRVARTMRTMRLVMLRMLTCQRWAEPMTGKVR